MAAPFVEAIPARFLARLHHPGGSGNGCYWGSAPRSAHAGCPKAAVKWVFAFLCVPVLHPASRVSDPTALQKINGRSNHYLTSSNCQDKNRRGTLHVRDVDFVQLRLGAAYVQALCRFVDSVSPAAAV
jgi:hypothetical protein